MRGRALSPSQHRSEVLSLPGVFWRVVSGAAVVLVSSGMATVADKCCLMINDHCRRGE